MKVRDVMTKNPITISPDNIVRDALDIIDKFHVWSIPVISEGKIVGIVTKQDIDLKSKSYEQKISDIMSKTPITISPSEELSVAADTIKNARINALIVVDGTELVGILTRHDIYKKPLPKIGVCQYCHPRGDDTEKELFQCKYCKGWFCKSHTETRKPMLAPFKSTDIEEHIEWNKKGGHPCIPYIQALIDEEKISNEKLLQAIYRSYGKHLKPTIEHTTYPVVSRPTLGKDKTRMCKFCFKKSNELIRCEYCGDFFCNDHIEAKTTHDFLRSKGGHSCSSYANQLEKVKKKEEPKLETPKEIDKKSLVFKITGVILVIVLLFSLWLVYNQTNEALDQNSKLSSISTNIENIKNQLNSVNADISSTETNIQTVYAKIQLLKSGAKYDLHNPTYSEVTSFLAKDKTNSNTYSLSSYTCAYFSKDVNNNAESKGIRCAYVELSFPGIGHAIVAFETTDKGLVYFEPQYDARANIELGKKFYTCLANRPGYRWVAPSYDDTIEDIVQFW